MQYAVFGIPYTRNRFAFGIKKAPLLTELFIKDRLSTSFQILLLFQSFP